MDLRQKYVKDQYGDLVKAHEQFHNTFWEAAVDLGLLTSENFWLATAKDACDALQNRHRFLYWIAIFLANINAENPQEILDYFLEHLAHHIEGEDQRRAYVLERVEYILRRHGIQPGRKDQTACEFIGLQPAPQGPMSADDLIAVCLLLLLLFLSSESYPFIFLG